MNSKIPNDGFSPVPGEPSASSSQGPPTALLPQETTPEPDFNASVCLRGPCKYLWQVQTNFDHGNTKGTFEEGKEPKRISRSCLRRSPEMDLDGMCVYTCNQHSNTSLREDPAPFHFEPEEEGTKESPDLVNLPTVRLHTTTTEDDSE